jgi:enoyl-CoA hydratase/carnithine racemase
MAINYEVSDNIAYISFCRPEKHNALRDEDLRDLATAVTRLDYDDSANIGILHGGQGPSFSSGADVADRLQRSVDDQSGAGRADERDAFLRCENWKPIIAAVHGYCLGHALSTALMCDHLIATRSARFQVTEVTLGVPASGIVYHFAGRPMFANEIGMTGRFFDADEAWQAGIVTRLVDDGQHVASAAELAQNILANPQGAVREMVRMRRSLVAEQSQHIRSISGTYKWAQDAESKDRIGAKLAKVDERTA